MRVALLILFAFGCAEEPSGPSLGRSTHEVVYGADDRLDVYAHPSDVLRDLARQSTAAIVPGDRVDGRNPDDVRLRGAPLWRTQGVCPGERFWEQPTASDCSATLVAEDLFVTAGHCVDDVRCSEVRFVFDWLYSAEGALETIGRDDVYRCAEVVGRRLSGGNDVAVVRADRPVVGRVPADVRWDDAPLPVGTPLVLIGYPSGLPAKIDAGGAVTVADDGLLQRFQATVDAFGGNSGSGVFTPDGVMVGVLVAGNQDYVQRGACFVPNELPDGTRDAEDVVYVARGREALCVDTAPDHPLCGTPARGFCLGCAGDDDCAPGFVCADAPAGPVCARACPEGCRPASEVCVDGLCLPRSEQLCEGTAVYAGDACGRAGRLVERCAAGERCEAGACFQPAAGDTCGDPLQIEARTQILRGSTVGLADDDAGRCAGGGPDRFFAFELQRPARVQITATGFDTVLYLRDACAGRELGCNDDASPPGGFGSHLDLSLEPGPYVFALDAYAAGEGGDYELSVTVRYEAPPPPVDAGVVDPDAGPPPPPVDAGVVDAQVVDAEAPPPPRDARVSPWPFPLDSAVRPRPRDAEVPDAAPPPPPPPPPADATPPPPPPVDATPPTPPPADATPPQSPDATRLRDGGRWDAAPSTGGEDTERDIERALTPPGACSTSGRGGAALGWALLLGLSRRRRADRSGSGSPRRGSR